MLLVRAVVTGFGLSLGSAIFKKVQSRLGFEDEDKKDKEREDKKVTNQEAASDPSLT